MRRLVIPLLCAGLAGCSTLPDVPLPSRGFDADAEYPDFVPMRRVTMQDRAAAAENAETEAELEARLASLRARAARLRNAPTD